MDKNLLYRYFEGFASSEDEIQLKRWLEESLKHEWLFREERKRYDLIILSGERTNEALVKRERLSHRIPWTLLKAASIIVLVLLGSHWYYARQMEKIFSQTQTISIPPGQHINLTLPDGTTVWLNSRTTFQYPVTFRKNQREVTLKGEAYFEVKRDAKAPFIVRTDHHKVEVLGTKFNIQAYDETEFEATLMEGKVKVASIENPEEALILAPETKACIVNGRLKAVRVDEFNHYRWKEGLICFKNESFSRIMHEFEKYYGVQIRIATDRVNKYTYTGKFRQTDGVDYALRVLQKDIQFRYEKDEEHASIFIK